MWCKHGEVRIERPTSGSCRKMTYCKKLKQYCFKQCEKKDRAKK